MKGVCDESVWLTSLAEHDNMDKFVQLTSLRKGYQGAGRMLFSMGSKGKIKKGAGRLNLIREQGAGKQQKLEGSKENVKKEQGEWSKIRSEQGDRTPFY